jgi:protein ImuA
MLHAGRDLALSELRERIERLEGRGRPRTVLPFGVRMLDRHLPGGGLALGAVHEVMEAGAASEHAAAATLFVAGILARNKGPVLWCVRRRDLFAPALAAWACIPIASSMPRRIGSLRFWPPPKRGFGTKGLRASLPRLRGSG